LQPALFTRLTVVEDELSAVKGMLAELQVSQDELRRDGDEWRWRAERLFADLQRGRGGGGAGGPMKCSTLSHHGFAVCLPACRTGCPM
jgi:hypothetical protein